MSKVSKNIFQDNDPNTNFDNKTIVIGMSINLRSMPESLEKHKILNDASGHPFHLKLIDDPLKEGKEVQDAITTHIKNPYRNIAGVKLITLLHTLVFSDMVTDLANDNYDNIDIWASNVPGPKKELYFAGIKATELVVIPTANNFNFFIAILSYAGKFRISLTLDSALKVCPDKFIELMEKEIEKLINKN